MSWYVHCIITNVLNNDIFHYHEITMCHPKDLPVVSVFIFEWGQFDSVKVRSLNVSQFK